MKHLTTLLLFLCLGIISGCGSDDDILPEDVLSGSFPLFGYSGSLNVTSANQETFSFQGTCLEEDDTPVHVRGSILLDTVCTAGVWQVNGNLSYLPNGKFLFKITEGETTNDLVLTKNTLPEQSLASYEFSNSADAGEDANGSQDAVSFSNVSVLTGTGRSDVLGFDGALSTFQINDGSFFNSAFTQRSISFYFKASDFDTSQILFDEGGTTNGFALKLENKELILATRSGGSGSQDSINATVDGKQDSWVHVVAIFSNGELKLSVDGVSTSKTLAYASIPSHSDSGGIGARHGSGDAFGSASSSVFTGMIDDVLIFNQTLSDSEIALIRGQDIPVQSINPLEMGKVAQYDFENAANLELDSLGKHNAQSVVDVTGTVDPDYGNVASFNGATSAFQLSNGSFLNDEFSERTMSFKFKTNSILASQTLIDEGGSTNGLVIFIENGYLRAAVRNGGSSSQQDLIVDIIEREDEWIKVTVVFKSGGFQLYLGTELAIERTANFSTVSAHSSSGGIGYSSGGNSSDMSEPSGFDGFLDEFMIYDRALSALEISFL